jgi:SAM-dependent methyltransferase
MSIDANTREQPKEVLQAMEVHDGWIRHFRGSENQPFYDLAFDYIASEFGEPGEEPVVDAGCGSGTKSLQLARRGFRVLGLDLSHSILDQARAAANSLGVGARTEFRQGDLTKIDLPTHSTSRAMCWGVLMHVPDIAAAVAELARIVKPGGKLVISEGNKRSLQAGFLRGLKGMLGRERAEVLRTPAGIEFWEQTSTGRFMTRQADIPWLIREFEKHGLKLRRRRAGQFTEMFILLPWKPLRSLVHAANNLWFRMGGAGGPAFGNLLVFERPV